MCNFAYTKICVLRINGSLGFYKCFFEGYTFSQIFKKRELREIMYSVKISTFIVIILKIGFLYHCLIWIC